MHEPTGAKLQPFYSYFWCNLVMPRVVEDQRRTFDQDDLFIALARLHQVRYSNLPHAPIAERREKLISDCHEGTIPLTFPQRGINLDLLVRFESDGSQASTSEDSDYARLQSDSNQVEISSRLILNGVCVRWRGVINRETLDGQGRMEFDQVRAQHEEQQLQLEMQALGERFRQLQQHLATTATTANHMQSPPAVTTTSSDGSVL